MCLLIDNEGQSVLLYNDVLMLYIQSQILVHYERQYPIKINIYQAHFYKAGHHNRVQ